VSEVCPTCRGPAITDPETGLLTCLLGHYEVDDRPATDDERRRMARQAETLRELQDAVAAYTAQPGLPTSLPMTEGFADACKEAGDEAEAYLREADKRRENDLPVDEDEFADRLKYLRLMLATEDYIRACLEDRDIHPS